MTANVENKRSIVSKAIAASLVGVLALGGGAALSTTYTQEAFADDAASLQTEDKQGAFERGTITPSGLSGNAKDGYTATLNSNVGSVGVNKFTLSDLTELTATTHYTYSIHKGSVTGEEMDSTATFDEVGTYYIVVDGAGIYKGYQASLAFTVGTVDITNAKVSFKNAAGDPITSLTYTGSDLSASVVVTSADGIELKEGTDYTVKFLTSKTGDATTAPGVTLKDAGTYYAYIQGIGNYTGVVKAEKDSTGKEIKVAKFDLSQATVEVDDVYTDTKPTTPSKVYYADGTELDPSLVNLEMRYNVLFDLDQQYTFVASSDNANVTGKNTTVKVNKVTTEASFLYDGSALESSYSIENGKSFDPALLTATAGTSEFDNDKLSISVVSTTDDKYSWNKGDKITEPGTYEVTVSLDAAGTSYAASGKETFTVTIAGQALDADVDAYYYKNGVIITEDAFAYDGTTGLSAYSAKLVDSKKGAEIASSDYKVTWTKDGEEIDDPANYGVMGVGTYVATLSSVKYDLSGVKTLTVVVSPMDLTGVTYDSVTYLGDTFAPEGYTVQAVDTNNVNKDGYANVYAGSSEVTLTWKKLNDKTGEFEDTTDQTWTSGTYQLIISLDEKADPANYTLPTNTTIEFVCRNAANDYYFRDVTADMWQYDAVNAVAAKKIMNGYSNTAQDATEYTLSGEEVKFYDDGIFGVYNNLTRAEATAVLYNMAAAAGIVDETELPFNNEYGFVTGFEDVDNSGQYWFNYSKCIGWAKQMGVVNGYGDGTNFGPNDPVTAEQWACMLCNYAEKIDLADTSSDGSALAKMADAADVSDWAKDGVAWAVDQKILGNAGSVWPLENIERGRVAAMVYNYGI